MDSLQNALDAAYRYLGLRDRTVAEVRGHLVDKKLVGEEVAREAIDVLIEQGYLDDERFARRFAEDRRALDSWGSERIERQLATLGIAQELIAGTVGAREHGDELEAAVALLERRFPAKLADPRERQRALGVLVRKGYELDLAYAAIRRCASGDNVGSVAG